MTRARAHDDIAAGQSGDVACASKAQHSVREARVGAYPRTSRSRFGNQVRGAEANPR